MRSAYHVRELEVHRLLRLRQPLDVFLSHDWPQVGWVECLLLPVCCCLLLLLLLSMPWQ